MERIHIYFKLDVKTLGRQLPGFYKRQVFVELMSSSRRCSVSRHKEPLWGSEIQTTSLI